MRWLIKPLAAAIAALALAGCANTLSQTPAPPEELQATIQILAFSKGRKEKFNAVWQRKFADDGSTSDTVRIINPLGGIFAMLSRGPDETVLEWRGRTYRGKNPEHFTDDLLGYPLPLESFGYWLAGEPSPHHSSIETMTVGQQLKSISQQGWTVTYHEFDDAISRPLHLEIEGDAGDAIVTIKKWIAP